MLGCMLALLFYCCFQFFVNTSALRDSDLAVLNFVLLCGRDSHCFGKIKYFATFYIVNNSYTGKTY